MPPKVGLKRAQAALEMASYQLSYTRIVAPVDGMVGERAVRVGAYVTPGSKILAVVPLADAYVVANFQETQLSHMHAGQAVQVRVDSLDGEVLNGHLESLAPATGRDLRLGQTRQRHRQLHQGGAAYSGEDRPGAESATDRASAGRDVGGSQRRYPSRSAQQREVAQQ
jgi:membrane fusion protein, multidrug efflux system